MTIILDLPPGTGAAIRREAARRGTTPERLALDGLGQLYPETDVDATLAALQRRPAAMTVADLEPRTAPPPGTNGMEHVLGHWPGDEPEEELRAALEALE